MEFLFKIKKQNQTFRNPILNFQFINFSRNSEKVTEEDDFDYYYYPDDNVERRRKETDLKGIGTYH